MEDEYGMYGKGSTGWSSLIRNEEFQETDVWSIFDGRKGFAFDSKPVSNRSSSSSFTSSAARMIPRPSPNNPQFPQQQSAPVNIPDWSKIYGKSKSWDSDDGDDDDNDEEMMPPHEWIAQKLARSQISSFSVCEGAGRTLKGRDLSRVRDAVLTKTGFLE